MYVCIDMMACAKSGNRRLSISGRSIDVKYVHAHVRTCMHAGVRARCLRALAADKQARICGRVRCWRIRLCVATHPWGERESAYVCRLALVVGGRDRACPRGGQACAGRPYKECGIGRAGVCTRTDAGASERVLSAEGQAGVLVRAL
jgi:hypothetical protein